MSLLSDSRHLCSLMLRLSPHSLRKTLGLSNNRTELSAISVLPVLRWVDDSTLGVILRFKGTWTWDMKFRLLSLCSFTCIFLRGLGILNIVVLRHTTQERLPQCSSTCFALYCLSTLTNETKKRRLASSKCVRNHWTEVSWKSVYNSIIHGFGNIVLYSYLSFKWCLFHL